MADDRISLPRCQSATIEHLGKVSMPLPSVLEHTHAPSRGVRQAQIARRLRRQQGERGAGRAVPGGIAFAGAVFADTIQGAIGWACETSLTNTAISSAHQLRFDVQGTNFAVAEAETASSSSCAA